VEWGRIRRAFRAIPLGQVAGRGRQGAVSKLRRLEFSVVSHFRSLVMGCGRALAALGLLLASGSVLRAQPRSQTSTADRPPNLLFFLSDDQGLDAIDLPGAGNELGCHTPHLAALAREGMVLTGLRMNPYCSPSRAAILTGRTSFSTGVTFPYNQLAPTPNYDLFSLQDREVTLAELLRAAGYHTIFVDKWHLGTRAALGQTPRRQGFGRYIPTRRFLGDFLDHPGDVGDEHITRQVDRALAAVAEAPRHTPWALFFWSTDPHSRLADSGGLLWWRVDPALAPRTHAEGEETTNLFRYRAVVESLDTELFRLLQSLGIVDRHHRYRSAARTVVLFTSDNGTPTEVSAHGFRAKGTLYEGGIRVPLLVFGENVPRGEDARILSAVDLFDTLLDVARLPIEERDAATRDSPRSSFSFADAIGHAPPGSRPLRSVSVSSLAAPLSLAPQQIAVVGLRRKLLCPAGGPGFADPTLDLLFDLDSPRGETVDVKSRFSIAHAILRERALDLWPSAVSAPHTLGNTAVVHVPQGESRGIVLESGRTSFQAGPGLAVGHTGVDLGPRREFQAWIRFDVERIEQLLPEGFGFENIAAATLVTIFDRDAAILDNASGGEDTGPIRAHRLTGSWAGFNPPAHDEVTLGEIDLPAQVLSDLEPGVRGVPVVGGTPLALGHREELLSLVHGWREGSCANDGIVLLAAPLMPVTGDQTVGFRADGTVLRLFLRR